MEKSKGSAKGAGKLRPGHEQPQTNIQRQQGEEVQQPRQQGEQLKQKQQGQQQKGKKTSR